MEDFPSGPLTGGVANPARHLGPATYAGAAFMGKVWLYWLGPVAGGVVAGLLYRFVLEGPDEASGED